MDPPRPTLQNPLSGTTINTDPRSLHVTEVEDKEMSQSVVERLIRKTSQVTKSGHRKIHSLSRKAKSPHDASGQCQDKSLRRAADCLWCSQRCRAIWECQRTRRINRCCGSICTASFQPGFTPTVKCKLPW